MTNRLVPLVEKFKGVPVLVVGDLILDHYIWGKVDRISPEAPVVVVNVTNEDKRPGGAGNVVNNLVSLGADVAVCGVVGEDDGGREVLSQLKALGADVSGVLTDRARPTTVKTRVIAHAQQVVRFDREKVDVLRKPLADALSDAVSGWFKKTKGIVISDYAKGTISAPLFERISQGYEQGQLGLGKIPVLVDPKAPNYPMYKKVTVIKPNRGEAEAAAQMAIPDRKAAIEAAKILLKKWNCEMVMITLGEHGMVLASEQGGKFQSSEIETVAREVYDVSGAGDTVSAVFTLALAAGIAPPDAAQLANIAAGVVVAEIGTVPITAPQLKEALLESEVQ